MGKDKTTKTGMPRWKMILKNILCVVTIFFLSIAMILAKTVDPNPVMFWICAAVNLLCLSMLISVEKTKTILTFDKEKTKTFLEKLAKKLGPVGKVFKYILKILWIILMGIGLVLGFAFKMVFGVFGAVMRWTEINKEGASIGSAVQRGGGVNVYDEQGNYMFDVTGVLVGFTSKTVSVRRDNTVIVYDNHKNYMFDKGTR